MSGAAIGWAVDNLIWASAAMLLVLAIRRPVAAHFGAGIAYALWSIPLLRLVAPPADWLGSVAAAPLPSLPALVVVYEPGAETYLPGAEAAISGTVILLIGWAIGFAAFLVAQAWLYRRFLVQVGRGLRPADPHRGIEVLVSDGIDGPLALGLVRRRIVVPAAFFARYTPVERRLALDHERYHHRRGDIFANYLALVVLATNWFNPIAWTAFRAFRADQELSCDAAITAAAAPADRSEYARALVKSASRPGLVAVCPLNGADQLKRRLRMIARHRRDPRRMLAGGVATLFLGVVTLVSGAPVLARVADLELTAPTAPFVGTVEAGPPTAPEVVAPRAVVERMPAQARPKPRPSPEVAEPDAAAAPQIVFVQSRGPGSATPSERAPHSFTVRVAPDGAAGTPGAPPALLRGVGECREVTVGRGGEARPMVVCAPRGTDLSVYADRISRAPARIILDGASLRRTRDRIAADKTILDASRRAMLERFDALIARAASQ